MVFLGSSLVMGPAGAIAGIDSSEEKTVEVEHKTTPVANTRVEVSIDELRVWERVQTDERDGSRRSVGRHDFGTSGPIDVRVRSRAGRQVAVAELSESQLADLRPQPAQPTEPVAPPASFVAAATAARRHRPLSR